VKIDSKLKVNAPEHIKSSSDTTDLGQITKDIDLREKPILVFGTTFVTVFMAEIGDKTQLSTLLMSAESHKPWMVFYGSVMALLTTSLLGVLVGTWMAKKLRPETINIAAGVILLFISLMLIGDVLID
jgi:putative Ca2+/H+ antiporter (TMEM165/GDT1 family)